MSLIEATYLATRPDRDPAELAENIAREQSLEILDELIPDDIRASLLGRVLGVAPVDEDRWLLRIGYPEALASAQMGQLLQLLHGNVTFYPRIRLQAVDLPRSVIEELPGPIGGIPEIRAQLGVPSRPLLLTVLKPRGSRPEILAQLAGRFARGGGDLLKDDQNLVERSIEAFQARVSACAAAVQDAQQHSGKACLYLPHVAGSGDWLRRQLAVVKELGLPGVVLCPWVMGLESAATAAREFELMWLAHPAGAGVYTEAPENGIDSSLIFGTLPRLAGADLSIFPGSGGRISLGEPGSESAIVEALTGALGRHAATLPCSGGGKTLDRAPEAAAALGGNCAIVVGGDLLRARSRLEAVTRDTIARLEAMD
ncbi:RuBisCO large subunit C-terminal-like domain-containing protein [Wenzhouxiangella marina]|uniref:Uncharacterized protein n=1 Tax=Wenzhouxiangella marina TaxID=1579979 RepID=A0A0K0XW72_9GAMM|nr:RuBisCO large subunit C-terminal-like domain-containing protein [Wenzhouxiangella marina]AKS41877.1 hypothetical protein WM2015_1506 [Wenzhouxiangella marina]MBB6086357.1 ribulose-bisphosphate carboxylase large chain [Wenzhouxiangella marina]